jgi:hypothetical protein
MPGRASWSGGNGAIAVGLRHGAAPRRRGAKAVRQPLDRTILIIQARKDLQLCFPHQGQGCRYYGTELFTPESEGRFIAEGAVAHGNELPVCKTMGVKALT